MPRLETMARIGFLALLLALVAGLPLSASATAAKAKPQCSDGADNDSDNAIDGIDAGCSGGSDNSEDDSVYEIVKTVPLAVVKLQALVSAKGAVKLQHPTIEALRGSHVTVTCKGRKCPFKSIERIMIATSLRLKAIERTLRPPLMLTFKIKRPEQLGRYVRYKVRRNKPPVRIDSCLAQDTAKVRPCFVG